MCTVSISTVVRGLKSQSNDDLIVHLAIPVLVDHVLDPRVSEVKMAIAYAAIVVIRTLYVVLPQRFVALEINVAVIAEPVGA